MLYQDQSSPKDSSQQECKTSCQSFVPTAPLPQPISQNIETIIALHKRN
jgi:hypothetical protein